MTWATMVGANGKQRRATTWVMMWAMMWATGTMAATMPVTMLAKGMVGTPVVEGGLLAEEAAAAVAAVTMATAAAYCRGCLFFIVKIFLCGIFVKCGENRQRHTSPHTLVMLKVCRRTFGWGR